MMQVRTAAVPAILAAKVHCMHEESPRSIASHHLGSFLIALLVSIIVPTTGASQESRSRWSDLLDSASDRAGESEIDEIEDFLETDRNSFTLARRTAGRNRVVIESAYSFLNPPGDGVRHSFPEFLVRYGITERFEIRLGWNQELSTGQDHGPAEAIISNFFGSAADQQLLYGIKYELTSQQDWRPESAIVIQGHTPTGGRLNTTHPRIGGVFGWRLSNDWNIDYACWYGPDSDLGDHFNI